MEACLTGASIINREVGCLRFVSSSAGSIFPLRRLETGVLEIVNICRPDIREAHIKFGGSSNTGMPQRRRGCKDGKEKGAKRQRAGKGGQRYQERKETSDARRKEHGHPDITSGPQPHNLADAFLPLHGRSRKAQVAKNGAGKVFIRASETAAWSAQQVIQPVGNLRPEGVGDDDRRRAEDAAVVAHPRDEGAHFLTDALRSGCPG